MNASPAEHGNLAPLQLSTLQRSAFLLPLALILLLYSSVGNFDYVTFDDPVYIADNPHLRQGLNGDSIQWALTTTYAHYWGPVLWLSFLTEAQLFGIDPDISHWINLTLHIFNSLILLTLLIISTRKYWPALCVALLFAIHPSQVEAVCWVTARKDLLSCFFGLLTLLSYTLYCQKQTASIKAYLGTGLLFTFSVCSKPSMVPLPLLMLVMDYGLLQRQFNRSLSRRIMEKIPLFIIAFAVALVTIHAQSSATELHYKNTFSFTVQLAHIWTDYFTYLIKILAPVNLAVFYPRGDFPDTGFFVGATITLPLISFFCYRHRKQHSILMAGWLWYVLMLAPMSGLVPFGRNVAADRFIYCASIGFFILLVYGVNYFIRSKKTSSALACIVIVTLLPLTHKQASHWQNSFTLFQRAINVTEGNYLAYDNLGKAYLDNKQATEALVMLKKASVLVPDSHETLNNLGIAYDLENQPQQAEKSYRQAITLAPNDGKAYGNLGALLARNGQYDQAIFYLNKAMELEFFNEKTMNNLAGLYILTGQYSKATRLLQRALQLSPNNPSIYFNLGYAHSKAGQYQQALSVFTEAQAKFPDNRKISEQLAATKKMINELNLSETANENLQDASH